MASLSVIIPLYNEEQSFPKLKDALKEEWWRSGWSSLEVILVDDGSSDRTRKFAHELAHEQTFVRLISYPVNQGKGYAVRTGMLAATGQWRLFLDADLAVSLDQIASLTPIIERGSYSVIIGSRTVRGASIDVPQSFLRQGLGKMYTILARIMTGVRVSDFTCGFKCFSSEAAQKLFSAARIDRWSFDAELLYVAKELSLPIYELGVHWRSGDRSAVRIIPDAFLSLVDLLRIRLIHHYIV